MLYQQICVGEEREDLPHEKVIKRDLYGVIMCNYDKGMFFEK